MTCTWKSSEISDIYEISVSTRVDCPSHSIQPNTSAPHQIELTNFSPVSAEVQLRAECMGDGPLSYSGKQWQQKLSLPPVRRWKRTVPSKFFEELTHDGTAPPQGGKQRIQVVVTTVPPAKPRDIYPLSETYADVSLYVRC